MKPFPPPPGGSRRVLIVDDEPRMRDMLSRAVTEMGFDAQTAGSAESGLRAMEQSPADIVLLDLNLPGMGGMDMFHSMKKKWPRIQVIILTGFGDLSTAQQAIRLEAVDFLAKPCPLGQLEQALERARQRQAATAQPLVLLDPPENEAPPIPAAPVDSELLEDVERNHILAALERHGGNRAAAAGELGISLRKLYYRLEKYQRDGRGTRAT
jgi:DNA-binding NtrC family response regulator